jgi:hypothetical protein
MNAIEMLEIVATTIADLTLDVTFTGGATIPLYLDAIAALEVRPTDDVDCVVEVTTQAGYYRLAAQLRKLGLEEDTTSGAPLCQWLCRGIKLDVMPIDNINYQRKTPLLMIVRGFQTQSFRQILTVDSRSS